MANTSLLRRSLEILAVLLTAAGKVFLMDAVFLRCYECRFPVIAAVILGWLAYIFYQYFRDPHALYALGFRLDNFWKIVTWRQFYIPALLAVAVMFLVGYLQGTINLKKEMIYIMILYPVWGFLQQYLLIALVVGNLDAIVDGLDPSRKRGWYKPAILIGAATLFASIHASIKIGNWWMLVGGTFLLASYYIWLYRREKNLYVLGLFHGWLGSLMFYVVVGRDVWEEFFGGLLR